MIVYLYLNDVTFLSLNKKVTKELSIGEALSGLQEQDIQRPLCLLLLVLFLQEQEKNEETMIR